MSAWCTLRVQLLRDRERQGPVRELIADRPGDTDRVDNRELHRRACEVRRIWSSGGMIHNRGLIIRFGYDGDDLLDELARCGLLFEDLAPSRTDEPEPWTEG